MSGVGRFIKGGLLRLVTRGHRKKMVSEGVKSVLFFRYDKIGDMIVSSPVFRELKLARPDVKIYVLASKSNASAIKYNPYVDQIFIYPYGRAFRVLRLMWMLRRMRIDCVIEFYHSVIWHAIVNILLINPKYMVSTYKDGRYGVGPEALRLYDQFSPNSNLNRHLSDIYLETLIPLGVHSSNAHYDFFCGDNELTLAQRVFDNMGVGRRVVINIQGSRASVRFGMADLITIIGRITNERDDLNVLLLGLPESQQFMLDVAGTFSVKRVFVSPVCEDVIYAAAMVKGADLVITPDTSVVHIACAFDVPLVAVYVNNQELFTHFSPRHSNVRVVFCKSRDKFEGYDINDICDKALELL